MKQVKKDGQYHIYTEKSTPEENEILINKIAKAEGDEKEKLSWELTENNFPLIIHMITKYFSRVTDRDSMISDGTLALFESCKNIEANTPNKKFTTYVCKCICGKIIRGLKKRSNIVKDYTKNGIRHNVEGMSYDAIEFDIEDKEFYNDYVISNSDGEYCGDFIKDIKDYYKERKTSKHHGFFDENTERILEGLKNNEEVAEISKKYNISKQRIDQIKQSMFIYAVQTLRDSSEKEVKNFFDVLYKGKYSFDNPPPLTGWRKDFWDMIFDTDKYKTHTNYKKALVEKRKVNNVS